MSDFAAIFDIPSSKVVKKFVIKMRYKNEVAKRYHSNFFDLLTFQL